MKTNESAALYGSEVLQLYFRRLSAALGELTAQAPKLRDETNAPVNVVTHKSHDGSQDTAAMPAPERGT